MIEVNVYFCHVVSTFAITFSKNMASFHTLINGRGGVKEVLNIAVPMVISMAADTLMAFTDRLFLAKLSPEHMSASMGGALGAQMLMFFFIGLTGFSTALVAQNYGAGKKQNCPAILYQTIIIITAAVPLIFLLKPLSILFFENSVSSAIQLSLQKEYFNILIYGSFFFLLRHSFSCYFSGIGRTKAVMIANLTALASNTAINYILIFGKFGFPAMGVKGAAIGSIVSMAIACGIMLFVFLKKKNINEFKPRSSKFFDVALMKKLIHFGYPAGIEMFLNFGAFTLLMHIFYSHSSKVATATTIIFNWDGISFIPLIGLEIAVTSLVGKYIGQRKLALAHRSTISALLSGSLFSIVVFVLFLSIPEVLCNVFRPAEYSETFEQALPLAVNMLRLTTVYILTEAVMLVFMGALRGAGDTHWTMIASVSIHALFTTVGFLMLKIFHFSPISTWLAIVITFTFFALIFFFRYKKGKWKSINVLT